MIEELKLLIEFMSGIQADVMPVVYAWLVISIAKWLIVAGILGGGVYFILTRGYALILNETNVESFSISARSVLLPDAIGYVCASEMRQMLTMMRESKES